MKYLIPIAFCLCVFTPMMTAQVGINEDQSLPDPKAMLDIKSTNKGILIPRMNAADRGTIVNPPISLMVYQTDGETGYYYYTGIGWVRLGDDQGWKTYGNAGTMDGVNFMGTTDNQPICFRVNNTHAGRIAVDGIALGNQAGLNNAMPYNTIVGTDAFMNNTSGSQNTALGNEALRENSSGSGNTALGATTLKANTDGYMNVAVGFDAARKNTSGAENTSVGSLSMQNNTTGNRNVALGRMAAYNNTTADQNVAVGFKAGYANQTAAGEMHIGYEAGLNTTANLDFNGIAFPNTYMGYQAGYSNTSGYGNFAAGNKAAYQSITANRITAVGYEAGYSNQTASMETYYGFQAGYSTTTNWGIGQQMPNTFLGHQAGYHNLSGYGNLFVGHRAGYDNSTGNQNTATGFQSLYENTEGNRNTAMGTWALRNNTTGSNNTAIGPWALIGNETGNQNIAIGANALDDLTDGDNNVAIGMWAGASIISEDGNILIGHSTDIENPAVANAVAIGAQAMVGASNAMALGGTGSYQLKVGIGTSTPDTDFDIKQDDASGNERGIKLEHATSADDWRIYTGSTADFDLAFALNNTIMGVIDGTTGNYVPSSDMRLKKDITPLESVLDRVLQLQPKSYRFIAADSDKKALGFIAQEVETVFPEAVNEREDGFKGVAYDNFSVIAIQAIKEQQAIIQQQQDMLSQQQLVIDNLLERVQALEQE